MRYSTTLSMGLAGAALMYFLDPASGRRRRAMLRDRMTGALHRSRRFGRRAARDLLNRASGASSQVLRLTRDHKGSDDELTARVRTAFGRIVSHPGAVHVMSQDGVVRLDGAVLAHELEMLLTAIYNVEGVRRIDNRLLVAERGRHIPGLQGAGTPPRRRVRRLLRAPGVRLASLALSAGTLAILAGRRLAHG